MEGKLNRGWETVHFSTLFWTIVWLVLRVVDVRAVCRAVRLGPGFVRERDDSLWIMTFFDGAV
jgi:hypothetical protein